VAKSLECAVSSSREDVSFERELPPTWDGFLSSLKGTERHEIRRKLRRLDEAAEVRYRIVEDVQDVRKEIDTFLALFGSNRPDKAAFMTSQRASFFRSLAEAMAESQILKLFFLDLDDSPAAAVMCFDYRSTIYLYNNGYDHRYGTLSVGLLSKVLSIREAIQMGRKKYDFLKGDEAYKRRLGGKPVPLYRIQIRIG
jgi:CelD/BcsL family acetyltransferase involved in cellulose biosynthesis